MKHSTVYWSIALAALVPGCSISVTPMAPAPPPAAVVVAAPEAYVWDGVEFVGEYNGRFMYLNGGGVWIECDEVRLARFHGWERGHPDWRRNAIHNDRGHRRDERKVEERKPDKEKGKPAERKKEEKR
jgi:hypothetical protein